MMSRENDEWRKKQHIENVIRLARRKGILWYSQEALEREKQLLDTRMEGAAGDVYAERRCGIKTLKERQG